VPADVLASVGLVAADNGFMIERHRRAGGQRAVQLRPELQQGAVQDEAFPPDVPGFRAVRRDAGFGRVEERLRGAEKLDLCG
jgi:hypothetical protein